MKSKGETGGPIRGRVTRIALEPQRARRGDYLFRGLEILSQPDNRRTFLIIPESVSEFGRPDLYGFPALCWEGAEIAGRNVQLNNTLEDGSAIFVVTPETELVLEPFRPVSVTDAVEAASCIRLVDLRYRQAADEPFWMAKGRMVHSLFGYLLQHGSKISARDFAPAFQAARRAILEALPGSGVAVNERELEEEARQHFRSLKEWLEEKGFLSSAHETEVDRISSHWGLKGRADAVFYGEDCDTIVELKSGRVPVESHVVQLDAYGLLFEDDEGRRCEGYLIYSAAGKTENMRHAGRWSILDGRNRVVSLKHSYALLREPEADDGTNCACTKGSRCFEFQRCLAFYGDEHSHKQPIFTGNEKEYYERWFRLLSLDAWESESRFARVLDASTLGDRLSEGLTSRFMGISVSERTRERGRGAKGSSDDHIPVSGESVLSHPKREVVACLQLEENSVDVAPGDEVILHRSDPCARKALRARVMTADREQLTVQIKAPLLSLDPQGLDVASNDPDQDRQWFLDRIPFSRGREVARQALFRFLSVGDPEVIEAIARGSAKKRERVHNGTAEDLCYSEGLDRELNDEQEKAVRTALDSDPFHLVHGPPGTGKTRVLARLVRICLDRGERILVACPTNIALDRLLIALVELGVRDFLRIGGRSTVSDEFLRALAGLGNPPALLNDLLSGRMTFAAFNKRVAATRLMGATAYQCAAHQFFIRQRFDRVVIDEAGQLDEPATLGVLALAPRFVLGGDHLQLPPVVQGTSGETDAQYSLERSLFERLESTADPFCMSRLRTQYRMCEEIQEVPSRLFYNGTLKPAPGVAHRRLRISPGLSENAWMNRALDPDLPVVFLDVKGANAGRARPEEAMVAAKVVEGLIACGIPGQEIGVITPYRVQQALIRKLLPQGGGAAVSSVDTVDRFQGGEREVIILSLARSDGVTSFLADRKRLNVSLSRARSKLILLGHAPALEEHPLFAALLDDLERIEVNPEA